MAPFQPFNPGQQSRRVIVQFGTGEFQQGQLHRYPLFPAFPQSRQHFPQLFYGTAHGRRGQNVRHLFPVVRRFREMTGLAGRLRGVLHQEHSPEKFYGVGCKPAHVYPLPGQLGHQTQDRPRILVGHGLRQGGEGFPPGRAQSPRQPLFSNGSVRGRRLLQQAQSVPYGTVRPPGDRRQALRGSLVAFGAGHLLQVLDYPVDGNQVEVEPLAARADSVQQAVRLGGGQHEMHPLRGFFQSFQQGVARRFGEHVRLVQDEHPFRPAHRGHGGHPGTQLSDVLHFVVGGGVQLYYVQGGGVRHRPAGVAVVARLTGRGTVRAVEGFGQQAGGGGFTSAPRPGEQIGMGHPAFDDFPQQGLRNMFLADHLLEPLRPVFAIKGLMLHILIVPLPGRFQTGPPGTIRAFRK